MKQNISKHQSALLTNSTVRVAHQIFKSIVMYPTFYTIKFINFLKFQLCVKKINIKITTTS